MLKYWRETSRLAEVLLAASTVRASAVLRPFAAWLPGAPLHAFRPEELAICAVALAQAERGRPATPARAELAAAALRRGAGLSPQHLVEVANALAAR